MSAISPTTFHVQFPVACSLVVPAAEAMIGKKRENDFRRRVHGAAGGDVPAEYRSLLVSDGDVEMRPVRRYGSLEREDLERAFQKRCCGGIRETHGGARQAADAGHDEGRFDAMPAGRGLDRLLEIAAGVESQRQQCGRFCVHPGLDQVT